MVGRWSVSGQPTTFLQQLVHDYLVNYFKSSKLFRKCGLYLYDQEISWDFLLGFSENLFILFGTWAKNIFLFLFFKMNQPKWQIMNIDVC